MKLETSLAEELLYSISMWCWGFSAAVSLFAPQEQAAWWTAVLCGTVAFLGAVAA